MSAISRTQINKPSNFQDFERQCAVLWEHKLGDRNLQRYGRNGQRQNGVDIYGIRDEDLRKGVGIQCKLKEEHTALTEDEVRAECSKALKFRPLLTEFHILTTSPTDAKLQTLAAQLSIAEVEKGRKIRFCVWGWNSIVDEVGRYPDAILAFDDSYGVFAQRTIERVDGGFELQQKNHIENQASLMEIKAALQTISSPVDSTVSTALGIEKHLDSEIDGYRDLNVGGQTKVALALCIKLLDRVRDSASGRILFRIKANIGACHLHLGEEKEAVDWFLKAYEHAPHEPKAIANKGLAHLLLEDWDTVLEMGRQNLTTEAADKSLSSHVIQAARFASVVGDPLFLVPEKDRDTDGVLIALALHQRATGDAKWRETSRLIADRFPEEKLARQLAAEALLDEALDDGKFVDQATLTEDRRAKLRQSLKVLSELWEETKDQEGKFNESDLALCGNLILAFRALGDYSSAMETIKNALTYPEFPDNPDFALRAAVCAMEAGDPISEDLLPRISDIPSRNLLMVQIAVSNGDWEALSTLDPEVGSIFPDVERTLCQTAIKLAKFWKVPNQECSAPLEEIIVAVDSSVRSSVLAAQFCDQKALPQLANKAWNNTLTHVNESTHISGRMMAAMYAYKHQLWSKFADLLDGQIATDWDSEELRKLASALVQERPIKRRAVDFFDSLAPAIKGLPRYRYLEGVMNFNRGELRIAESIFDEALEAEPNLGLLEMMAMVLRRQNRDAEIPELLAKFDIYSLDGSPAEKMKAAHELRRARRSREALEFAYGVLRANPNDPDVNLAYITLVFSIETLDEYKSINEVAAGTWVRLSGSHDKEFSFVVEESGDDPSAGYLSPSHELVSLALGKPVGYSFSVPQQIGDEIIWTVAEIKHRYLQAFQDILDNFNTRFPTAKGFYSLTTKKGDVSAILNQVRAASENARQSIDLHLKSGLPLQMAAAIANKNPIEFVGTILEHGDDLQSCLGTDRERTIAFEIIQSSLRAAVQKSATVAAE